ncbi:unnamed protein product [Paramecium sonneborni]|uniref:Uncharacterized protein n=1 Tax=Paramecium sonneborni TaxID=65129 RepID=A0A8S1L7Z7_9CILI|nr:unnamed protein product [Paramecium sonneborni]
MFNSSQYCIFDGHQNSQIQGVCLNASCQNKRPYCHHCRLQHHSQHVNDLKNFEQLNDFSIQLAKVFEEIQNKFFAIQKCLQTLNDQLKELYVNPKTNFNEFNLTDLEKLVFKLLSLNQLSNSALLQNLNDFNKRLSFFNKEGLNQIKANQSGVLSTIKSDINQISNSISANSITLNPVDQNIFHFSEQLTFKGISIQENGKKAVCTGLEWGFAMCEPVILKKGTSRFVFQVCHSNICNLYVGVCHKDKIIQSNYSPNSFQKIGHGAYLIFSTGLILSHLQSEINYQFKGFSYSNNDIIIMEVDMNQQQIVFTHQQKQQQITMKLDVSQDLYPYAELCFGSSVQILQI